MRSIFIGSTGGGPGQTLTTWALALRLRERGLRVGFFKPYGQAPNPGNLDRSGACDADVHLFQKILRLPDSEDVLCPFRIPENHTPDTVPGDDAMEKIGKAFREASREKDVVLIMGAKEIFFGSGGAGISDSQIVKLFDSSVLLVDRYQRDNLTFYSLLSLNSFLNGRVKAAVLNHVPPERLEHVEAKVIPFLNEKGLKSVMAIPEDPVLAGFTVSAIAERVGGEVLCCPELRDNLVQTSTIGSNCLEAPLALFRQVYNKIILVGLAPPGAGPKPVVGIILTGGKNPGEMVLKTARDRGIPLFLTRADTFQVMELLDKAKPALTEGDEFKVRRFLELAEQGKGPGRWVEELLN